METKFWYILLYIYILILIIVIGQTISLKKSDSMTLVNGIFISIPMLMTGAGIGYAGYSIFTDKYKSI